MKKNCLNKLFPSLAVFFVLSMVSCTIREEPKEKLMRHSGLVDSLLRQSVDQVSTIRAKKGTRIFTLRVQGSVEYDDRNKYIVSSRTEGRIENLAIRYNYQPIRKGDLILEIYSPDIVAAQQELLFLQRHAEPELLGKARQKLLLLGMSDKLIDKVLSSRELIYSIPIYSPVSGYVLAQRTALEYSGSQILPASASSMDESPGAGRPSRIEENLSLSIRAGQYLKRGDPILTIYQTNNLVAIFGFDQQVANHISKGKNYLYQRLGSTEALESGIIDQALPSQRAGLPFSLFKTYLATKNYRPGEIIEAFIAIKTEHGSWLPTTAVYRSGQQNIIFKKEGGKFIAYALRTGLEQDGEVQVLNAIDGWEIALDAEYIVDPDSFLKPIPYAK